MQSVFYLFVVVHSVLVEYIYKCLSSYSEEDPGRFVIKWIQFSKLFKY